MASGNSILSHKVDCQLNAIKDSLEVDIGTLCIRSWRNPVRSEIKIVNQRLLVRRRSFIGRWTADLLIHAPSFEKVQRASVKYACICQHSIQPAVFLPHSFECLGLLVVVCHVTVNEVRLWPQLGDQGLANILLPIEAGYVPSCSDEIPSDGFADA